MMHHPGLRRQLADQQAHQGRLTRSIWPYDAYLIAALDGGGKIVNHRTAGVSKTDPLGFDHQPARAPLGLDLHAHPTGLLAP